MAGTQGAPASASQDTRLGSVQALIPVAPLQAPEGLPALPGPASVLPAPDGASWLLLICAAQEADAWMTGRLSVALRPPRTRRAEQEEWKGRGSRGGNAPSPRARGEKRLTSPPPAPNPPRTPQRPAQRVRHLFGCRGKLSKVRTLTEAGLRRSDLSSQLAR